MPRIRPATPADLAEITAIRRLSFRNSRHESDESLKRYLSDVFFDNPWEGDTPPSLVFEDDDARILGFLGCINRPLRYRGERITMGALSHFMVHPESRGKGVGRRLMEHFLNGPQDLFWSDVANDATRAVWTASGGTTARLHCLHWNRTLQPVRQGSAYIAGGLPSRVALRALRPVFNVIDAVVVRRKTGRFSLGTPEGRLEAFEPARVVQSAGTVFPTGVVQPEYTEASFAWLLGQLRDKPGIGDLETAMIVERGEVTGWLIWYSRRGGVGRVVQIASRPERASNTITHLLHAAAARGVVTLEGRIDPTLFGPLTDAGAVFRREDPWVMVHSRHAGLLAAVQGGDALLTRLDGEWWMSA